MAKSIHKLSEFKAEILANNVARTERFEAEIITPMTGNADRTLLLMCEECNVPSLVNTIKPHRINNWTHYRTTNMDFGGEANAVFTFIETQQWQVRQRLEEWMAYAVDPRTKEIKYPKQIEGRAIVKALDPQDEVTATWVLYGVIPKVLNMTPLSGNAPGVVRTTATFTFNRWESGNVKSFTS